MTVRRYPLRAAVTTYGSAHRELRVTVTSTGLVAMAIHSENRCVSGPLMLPLEALDTFRSALADVAGETPGEPEPEGPEAA